MRPLRVLLVGFGRMGGGSADDPRTRASYRFLTHADVLGAHPAYEWVGIVDPAIREPAAVQERYKVAHVVGTVSEIPEPIDVAVLSTPPDRRLGLLDGLKGLRAVLAEKPLATTAAEACRFVAACEAQGIVLAVNYWRRADEVTRSLAEGRMQALIGEVQAAQGVYGNGLLNNGAHMIDLLEMLTGARAVQAQALPTRQGGAAPSWDRQLAFELQLSNGCAASFASIDFQWYRENQLCLWGRGGRLVIAQDGLDIFHHALQPNRAVTGAQELSAHATTIRSSVGTALYEMYTDLAEAVHRGRPSCAPGRQALHVHEVMDAVLTSARENGRLVEVPSVLH